MHIPILFFGNFDSKSSHIPHNDLFFCYKYHEYIFLSLIISPIYDTSFIVKFLLYKVFQILHRFNHSTNRDNIFFINLRFHNNSFSTICIPH